MKRLYRLAARASLPLLAFGLAACSLDKQAAPSLGGPSEFGLSVTMTAAPDQLPRDGSSQSVVTVRVRDASGRGVSDRRITLGVTPGASLSQDAVVSGADGQATFAVTAPSPTTVVPNNLLLVTATPIGGDFGNAATRSLSIALVGTSNSTAPTPAFTVTPAAPEINRLATFDATTTTDEGKQCLDVCTYQWNFDDGATASGRVVTHAFTVARSYNVALTVTDAAGLVVTLRQVVTPTAPAEPTVTLTVAPNPPVVNQLATFNAIGTPAANHQIVQYEWNFGDGKTDTTAGGNITHTYGARGIYTATVRAVDELGRAGSTSLQLNLTAGVPTGINATFFFTPTVVHVNQGVPPGPTNFNASLSTPSNGASIVQYQWNWGDGNPSEDTAVPIITHVFTAVNSYVVKLTVVDSQGRTAATSQTIGVVP